VQGAPKEGRAGTAWVYCTDTVTGCPLFGKWPRALSSRGPWAPVLHYVALRYVTTGTVEMKRLLPSLSYQRQAGIIMTRNIRKSVAARDRTGPQKKKYLGLV
jgi:hypothetical protein